MDFYERVAELMIQYSVNQSGKSLDFLSIKEICVYGYEYLNNNYPELTYSVQIYCLQKLYDKSKEITS